jgi:hypothetical protein
MLDTCAFNWRQVTGIRLGGGPHTARYFFDRAADLIVASEHVHIELHVVGTDTHHPAVSRAVGEPEPRPRDADFRHGQM